MLRNSPAMNLGHSHSGDTLYALLHADLQTDLFNIIFRSIYLRENAP